MANSDNVNKLRLTLTIPTDLSIRLGILKEETKRTRNDLIVQAIKDFLDKKEEDRSLTEQIESIKNELKALKSNIK